MSLRLIFLAGIAIAFLALGGLALWYKNEATQAAADRAAVEAQRDQLQRDLSQAVGVNQENQETIDKMVAEGLRRDHIIVGMAEENSAIERELLDKTELLNRVKEDDADVAKYLGTPIPEALRKLRTP